MSFSHQSVHEWRGGFILKKHPSSQLKQKLYIVFFVASSRAVAHGGNSPWVASFPMSTIWIPQPIRILLYLMVSCKHRKSQSGSGRWRKPQRNAFRHGLLGIGHGQNDCDVNITYWCLVGNGWEWGNGTIIDSYCGSFFHSLQSTSKIRSNSSGEILPQHKSNIRARSMSCGAKKATPRFKVSSSDPWHQARWPMLLQ